MGIKNVFKKIWLGVKVAEPYLSMAGHLLPPPFGTIILALDELANRAEVLYPAAGSGAEKAEFFTNEGLKVSEILTGKNVDNPKTRALVAQIGTITVQIKNLETQVLGFKDEYKQLVADLKDAIDSMKDPAVPDAPLSDDGA